MKTTKELIKGLRSVEKLVNKYAPATVGSGVDEIIQRLREYDELRDLIRQAAVPSQRIAEFLGCLINLDE